MITDLIIGIAYNIYVGILAVLPDMPARPDWLNHVWTIAGDVNLLIPIDLIAGFLPQMFAVLGLMALWRVVRYLLPGG